MKGFSRKLIPLLALVAALALFSDVRASEEGADDVEFLMVQNCLSGKFDGQVLTMKGVGATLLFANRPDRVTAHLKTSDFIGMWGEGEDSLAEDPPNATISIFHEGGVSSVVVMLSDPVYKKGTLKYTAKVLDGDMPAKFKEASLFIDMFGRAAMLVTGLAVGTAVGSASSKQTTTYTQPATGTSGSTTEMGALQQNLQQLKSMESQGLITEEEYEKKKKELLKKY